MGLRRGMVKGVLPSVVALATIFVTGCSDTNRDTAFRYDSAAGELNHLEGNPRILEATAVSLSDEIGLPLTVAAIDSALVMIGTQSEPFLHLVAPTDGRIVRSMGRRGSGPGEFAQRIAAILVPEALDGFVWAYELGARSFTEVRIEPKSGYEPRFVRPPGGQSIGRPVMIDDSTVVAVSITDSTALLRISLRDGSTRNFGALIALGEAFKEVAPTEMEFVQLEAILCHEPGSQRLVRMMRMGGRVQILSPEGQLEREAQVPYRFEPLLGRTNDGKLSTTSSVGQFQRFGYLSCVTTREAIIALFSGRTRHALRRRAPFGKFLHVFSWDGALQAVFQLPHETLQIQKDGHRNVLYAIRADSTVQLLTYDLADIVGKK